MGISLVASVARAGSARVVNGTEPQNPRLVAGQSVHRFLREAKIKRVDVNWRVRASARNCLVGSGGSWNGEGHSLCRIGTADFAYPRQRRRTRRPDRTGPTRENFTPEFLPDSRRFLYYVRGRPEVRGVYIGQLDETFPRVACSSPTPVPSMPRRDICCSSATGD